MRSHVSKWNSKYANILVVGGARCYVQGDIISKKARKLYSLVSWKLWAESIVRSDQQCHVPQESSAKPELKRICWL